MNFIRKKVDSFSLTTFHPSKEYSVLLSETSSYNIAIKSSSYSSFQNINSFAEKERNYYTINQLFYKQTKSPYYASSRDIDLGWFKLLNEESKVIFIPTILMGDRIKAGSVQISASSNSVLISDNLYGQLIDDSATNIVSSSNLVGFWSFDDGYKTDGTKTNFYTVSLRKSAEPMYMYNTTFKTGIQSIRYCTAFDGDGYGRLNEYADMNLEKDDDFAVSFWLNVPTSQSVSSSTLNTVISKGDENSKRYFFKIDVYNHTDVTNTRKIIAYRKDEFSQSSITSTALTAGTFSHIVFQKTGSTLQLYVNNSSAGTATDNTNTDVYFKDTQDHLIVGGFIQSSSYDVVPEFSGSIDEIRFYDKALTSTEVSQLYTNPYNNNIIGNVYYKHGIIVLNNLSGSYANIYTNSNDTLKYKSVIELTEMKTELIKYPSEFNFTTNPSVFVRSSNFDNKDLISTVSSSFSYFSPYITTIGLMNDKCEILAVAKLKRPLKANQDLPVKFVIKIDI